MERDRKRNIDNQKEGDRSFFIQVLKVGELTTLLHGSENQICAL